MTDWNNDTGINSTSQRDSAMKSASTVSPVIKAISPKVSPAFNCPNTCRAPPSPMTDAATVPANTTPKCVASAP
jgi:hypothetical protein